MANPAQVSASLHGGALGACAEAVAVRGTALESQVQIQPAPVRSTFPLLPCPPSRFPGSSSWRVCGLSPAVGLSYVSGKGMAPRLQPSGLRPPPDIEVWLTAVS